MRRRVYIGALATVAPFLPVVAVVQADRELATVPVYAAITFAVVGALIGLLTRRLSLAGAERLIVIVVAAAVLGRVGLTLYSDTTPTAMRALVSETAGPTLVALILVIFLATDTRPARWWSLALFGVFAALLGPRAVTLWSVDPGASVALFRQALTLLVVIGLASGLASLKEQLSAERTRTSALAELAKTDPLTGALNRRGTSEVLAAQIDRAARYHGVVSVALLDLDRFKARNDHLGHAAGDDALVRIVATLGDDLRTTDTLGRWGGDELLIVAPETSSNEVHVLADRWRTRVADLGLAAGADQVTASVGVATYEPGDTVETLLMRADRAMYAAKAAGGDRVVTRLAGNGVSVVSFPGTTNGEPPPPPRRVDDVDVDDQWQVSGQA